MSFSELPEPSVDSMKAWNMAQFFYFSLNKLIENKDEAYMSGDIFAYYKSLRAILRRCVHKFSVKEKDEIKSALDEIYDSLISLSNLPKNQLFRGSQMIKPQIEKRLDEIDHLMTVFMDRHEMIEPRFSRKGVESIEKRMRL